MKVGTRITAATAALVALSLAVYAVFDLGVSRRARRQAVEREARAVATLLRSNLQTQLDSSLAAAATIAQQATRAAPGWEIEIVPASAIPVVPGTARERRLRGIVEANPNVVLTEETDRLTLSLPLRRPKASAPDGLEVAGILEVSRSTEDLAQLWRDDLLLKLPLLAVVVVLVVLAIMLFTQNFVTRPLEKLLAGMDEIKKGDLSRVLMAEREDEIGAMAGRYNEMTFSLRESRAETERQNKARDALEERLFKTEKMATIGQLAAEIAHEVGTPLNVIAGRARGLGKKSGDQAAVEKNANIIAEQATRITGIIQRLLDFARRKVGTVERVSVDVNDVVRTTMDFVEGRFSSAKVRHALDTDEELPRVSGHRDQIQQVLLNLILNALEALDAGGEVVVETFEETRRRPGLEEAAAERYAVVQVNDTGAGIPPDMRDEIFEPFYTTKEGSGGTGLGLAVSYGIIKEHDGWIEVDESPAGGAAFRVYLPAA